MKVENYHLKSESKFTRFEFISEGPKGAIRKLIEFQKTTRPDAYNLNADKINPETALNYFRLKITKKYFS